MSKICIFNRFSLMPDPDNYPLGKELERLAEVKYCDLQYVSVKSPGEVLYKEELLIADLFLWRIIEEYWQSAFHILSAAERAGYKTINNSQSIQMCADKAITNSILNEAGVAVAKARVIPRDGWAYPENGEILKPLDEGGGSGVRKIKNKEQVSAPLIQQNYLGGDLSFARILIINNKILGSHKRKSLAGSLANNFDLGGEIVAWEAPEKAINLALSAHKLSGAFFSAVDLVEVDDDWQVMEINSTPGYRGLVELYGDDIHRQVAEEISSYL
jgi:glutathione synthase/RimK-type ligase-like ATP-grasp enzyme